MLVGKDFCHPIELRRDLSHNGDLEVLPSVGEKGGRTNGTCWGTWGRGPPRACLLQRCSQCLCSESGHEKTSTIEIWPCLHLVLQPQRVLYSTERNARSHTGVVRAPDCNCVTAERHSQLCNEKQATALKELLLIHQFNKNGGEKCRKDRRKTHKLQREKKTEEKPKSF